jgi:hypothetical protein
MRELAAEQKGATNLTPRPAEFFKVDEKDRAWVDAQCTPQPIKCFLQKLTLTDRRGWPSSDTRHQLTCGGRNLPL